MLITPGSQRVYRLLCVISLGLIFVRTTAQLFYAFFSQFCFICHCMCEFSFSLKFFKPLIFTIFST